MAANEEGGASQGDASSDDQTPARRFTPADDEAYLEVQQRGDPPRDFPDAQVERLTGCPSCPGADHPDCCRQDA